MTNNSAISAALTLKCPRCRKGKLFTHSAYSTKFMSMYSNCPVCDVHYEVEPGFFYGSMYVSYAFSVAIFAIIGVLTHLFIDHPSMILISLLVVGVTFLFVPLSFRYSRSIYLHLISGIEYKKQNTSHK